MKWDNIPKLDTKGDQTEKGKFLLSEGFIKGWFDDCYSGCKNSTIWYNRLGTNDSYERITAVITKNEIGIEKEYSYGGGTTGGLWLYTEDDDDSFKEAYSEFVKEINNMNIN